MMSNEHRRMSDSKASYGASLCPVGLRIHRNLTEFEMNIHTNSVRKWATPPSTRKEVQTSFNTAQDN